MKYLIEETEPGSDRYNIFEESGKLISSSITKFAAMEFYDTYKLGNQYVVRFKHCDGTISEMDFPWIESNHVLVHGNKRLLDPSDYVKAECLNNWIDDYYAAFKSFKEYMRRCHQIELCD